MTPFEYLLDKKTILLQNKLYELLFHDKRSDTVLVRLVGGIGPSMWNKDYVNIACSCPRVKVMFRKGMTLKEITNSLLYWYEDEAMIHNDITIELSYAAKKHHD